MADHYETLGVDREATKEQITAAYRRLALLHHPDRNPGDKAAERRFMGATEAYSVLADEAKRLAYDLSFGPVADPFPNPGSTDFFTDMWGSHFGGRGARPDTSAPGKDVELVVQLTVEESVLGTTKILSSLTGENVMCLRCLGKRAEPGSRSIPCTHCAGSGRNFFRGRDGNRREQCRSCDGHGDVPIKKCAACAGVGTIRSVREISMKIPAGISDGQRLRLAGGGERGEGRPPGDAYVTIRVVPGGPFSRDGNNLMTSVRISFSEAMGHDGKKPEFTVRGINKKEYRVAIPPSFKPGETRLVIRGAGIGGMGGERGDLHVTVHVDLPEIKTARAAALVRELTDELTRTWHPPSPDQD